MCNYYLAIATNFQVNSVKCGMWDLMYDLHFCNSQITQSLSFIPQFSNANLIFPVRLAAWLPSIPIDRDRTGNWTTNNRRSAIRSIAARINIILLNSLPLLAVVATIATIVTTLIDRVIPRIVIDRGGS
jgi:hypothetical protein